MAGLGSLKQTLYRLHITFAVMWVWCACMVALVVAGAGELPPPEASYKILMLLPVSSKSHLNVFMPVAEALADRGHKIVMLTNNPKASNHPNIQEMNHELPHFQLKNVDMFDRRMGPVNSFNIFVDILPAMARELYKVPKVKQLYDKRKEFDLIIINHMFNEVMYPFVHEVPFITIATQMEFRQSAVLGNVFPPSYGFFIMTGFPTTMSMWHRLQNTVSQIWRAVFWRYWKVLPLVQKEISKQFPDLPPLLDIERNQSLSLINYHYSIGTVLPLLPSQVEVGAMHCRPSKPLMEDLESWISGAGSKGVIYFSIGSVAQGTSMPVQYRDAFVEAFKRLPHRVIWKFEGELKGVSDNVLMQKWLPQQDILGHEKVKVFITHGGLLSLQESIYHGTPLLSLPIYGDQSRNSLMVKTSGIGDMLVWEELTVDAIVDAVTDITTNPKYKQNVKAMSRSLRDQLTTPQERAVFWTEYVIRHRGAPQLRSPAAKLSWVKFLMLDVLFLLLLAIFITVYVMRRLFSAVSTKVFGDRSSKSKME